MEAKILRPLLWFGLLEYRNEEIPNTQFGMQNYYRKTTLFDRLLKFDVKMELSEGPRPDEPIILLQPVVSAHQPRTATVRRWRRWFDLSGLGKYGAVARFPPRPVS
jgi:hypothetical protein